jgi:alkaline phosphatase D
MRVDQLARCAMKSISRREFLQTAAALGAVAAFARAGVTKSGAPWTERRELFPEGVASGDPDAHSVLLWTRRPADAQARVRLYCEVAEDPAFAHVVASATSIVDAASDWTCRVLAGGLKPDREYWYRFSDEDGNGSRVGRTLTAPVDDDPRPVRFVFVSCQNVNDGAQNAYRRMIFEDQRAAPADRVGFVLHLGDFIYELVWYPQDRPQGMYDRRIRDLLNYPHGEKIDDFHVPTDVEDYRTAYRAYLHDPDLQEARAHFPFVNMWDNHEFSWLGWQSLQKFDGRTRPAQRRKVAAMQAWFEYQPARVRKPRPGLERFDGPTVEDAAISRFDDHGLGMEPNNLAALGSLTGYRALRWGSHVDLIITDQRSYRSEDPLGREEAKALSSDDFPEFISEDAQRILDAGRTWNGGKPPATIHVGDREIANFARGAPAQTILGAEQKRWFLQRLKASRATWKVWGNTTATLDMRADPQNLPPGVGSRWPGAGYAGFGGGDHSTAYVERAEIYDFVAQNGIGGFATIAGDRHSFWAGLAAKALPPEKFEPVGVAFVTGSISAPGMVEAFEHKFPKDHVLRPLFLADRPHQDRPDPAVNLLLHHGVRTCLDYSRSGDLARAKALSNPANAPHVSFVDMGGHGYSVVRASADAFEVEFVCIPRPVERSEHEDGGPLRYRVVHRARLWKPGQQPALEQRVVEGDAAFST